MSIQVEKTNYKVRYCGMPHKYKTLDVTANNSKPGGGITLTDNEICDVYKMAADGDAWFGLRQQLSTGHQYIVVAAIDFDLYIEKGILAKIEL